MTQIHFPTLAHPDFAGKTGAGDIADAMADDGSQRRPACSTRSTGWASRATRSCSGAPTTAPSSGGPWRGSRRAVERLLQHRHGRRHSHAVHHPLAGPHSRGPRLERDRPSGRSLPHARRRRRRGHRPEGSRHRRRQPAAVSRRQAGEVEPRQRDLLHEPQLARGQVARLEVPLRVPARAGRRRRCRR